MRATNDDSVQHAVNLWATEFGFARFSKNSWREKLPGGIRNVWLQRSQWSKTASYYPTVGFYPAEFLDFESLPPKRPLDASFPVNLRLSQLCTREHYKQQIAPSFDTGSNVSDFDREERILQILTDMVSPIVENWFSLDDIVVMFTQGKLPAGSVGMPVLAEIDPELVPNLSDYVFDRGEFVLNQNDN